MRYSLPVVLCLLIGCGNSQTALPVANRDAAGPIVIVATATANAKVKSGPKLPDSLGGNASPAPSRPDSQSAIHEGAGGGGSKPVPPPLTDDQSKAVTKLVEKIDRKQIYIRFYSAKDCSPCKVFLKWREENASSIGCEVEHLQFDNLDKATAQFPDGVPRFELMLPGGKSEIKTGWSNKPNHDRSTLCPDCLREWVRQAKGKPRIEFDKDPGVRVAAMAGLNIESKVADLFAKWDQYIGDGTPVTVKLYRPNGAEVIHAWRGGAPDLTPAGLIGGGQDGFLFVSAPGAKLPMANYQLEKLGGDVNSVWFQGQMVRVYLDGRIAPMAAAQPVGFIDPGTIIGALNLCFKLLGMHADALVPKQLEFVATKRGDTITVDIKRGPQLLLSVLWETYIGLPKVEVTRQGATLYLRSKNWLVPKKYHIDFGAPADKGKRRRVQIGVSVVELAA